MGAGQSTALPSGVSSAPKRALHILRVAPNSPAAQTDLEPFFDFVAGYEGANAQTEVGAAELEQIVEAHEDRVLNLLVWNSQNQDTRIVPITPSRVWSSIHADQTSLPETTRPSLLGLSMRVCEPELALENVWHVMDVLDGSPAESAGLVPYGDWIVGWTGGPLAAEGDFYEVVEAHVDKSLQVYVYSHDFHTIREVVLVPNRHWGGEGLLGCVFGFGLLHRIPPHPRDEEHLDPPELWDEDEEPAETLFVPADAVPGVNGHTYDDNDHGHDGSVSSAPATQSPLQESVLQAARAGAPARFSAGGPPPS